MYACIDVWVPPSKFSVFLGIIHVWVNFLYFQKHTPPAVVAQKIIDYSTFWTAEGWHERDCISREISFFPLFSSINNRAQPFPPISIQQLPSQTSISSIIATEQGGTQLQTLLSFLNSRLLILTGPHNSTSISFSFSCGGCSCLGGCLAGSSRIHRVCKWHRSCFGIFETFPVAPNEHVTCERVGRRNKFFLILTDRWDKSCNVVLRNVNGKSFLYVLVTVCCFWKLLSMGREAPAVNFICSCVNTDLLTFPNCSSVGLWHYVL